MPFSKHKAKFLVSYFAATGVHAMVALPPDTPMPTAESVSVTATDAVSPLTPAFMSDAESQCSNATKPEECIMDVINDAGLNATALNPYMVLKKLPDNVPEDFWDSDKPPSENSNPKDNFKFETLHCDKPYDADSKRAGGDCHYLAGELARFSEFHLQMHGTKAVIGTCALKDHLGGPDADVKVLGTLNNGLCAFGGLFGIGNYGGFIGLLGALIPGNTPRLDILKVWN